MSKKTTGVEFGFSKVSYDELPSDIKARVNAVKNKNKTETIDQFLARGGAIQIIPTQPPTAKPESIKSTTAGGPATIITMDEADLYHGEAKPRKSKKKVNTIDVSALPEALRKKYVDEVLSGSSEDEEEDEE
jgi:hypothetical protein